jgi:hypothetical protein
MKKVLAQFHFLIFLICTSCCETETKKNLLKETFSYTINGQEYYPKNLNVPSFQVDYKGNITNNNPSYFFISAENMRLKYTAIDISIISTKKPIEVGEYILNEKNTVDRNNSSSALFTFDEKGVSINNTYYRTTNEEMGKVNITAIDTIQRTIKGNFQFTAINDLQQKIVIQNGKFNTKY